MKAVTQFSDAIRVLAGLKKPATRAGKLAPLFEAQALGFFKNQGFTVPEDLPARVGGLDENGIEDLAAALAYVSGMLSNADFAGLSYVPEGTAVADQIRAVALEIVREHGFDLAPQKLPF